MLIVILGYNFYMIYELTLINALINALIRQQSIYCDIFSSGGHVTWASLLASKQQPTWVSSFTSPASLCPSGASLLCFKVLHWLHQEGTGVLDNLIQCRDLVSPSIAEQCIHTNPNPNTTGSLQELLACNNKWSHKLINCLDLTHFYFFFISKVNKFNFSKGL